MPKYYVKKGTTYKHIQTTKEYKNQM